MHQSGAIPIQKELVISSFSSIDYYANCHNFYQIPREHSTCELVYVEKGELVSAYAGVDHVLSAGCLTVYPAGNVHSLVSRAQITCSVLVVDFACSGAFLNALTRKIFKVNELNKKYLALFTDACSRVVGDITNPSGGMPKVLLQQTNFPGTSQLMESLFVALLLSLAENTAYEHIENSKATSQEESSSFTELIKRYMQDNLHQNLTLSDLCKKFNISQSNLFKKWKAHSDVGIMEYYLQLKLDEAKRLLEANQHTITQIADLLGYSSIHHFSHFFKRTTGLSPSEYRDAFLRINKARLRKENADKRKYKSPYIN